MCCGYAAAPVFDRPFLRKTGKICGSKKAVKPHLVVSKKAIKNPKKIEKKC